MGRVPSVWSQARDRVRSRPGRCLGICTCDTPNSTVTTMEHREPLVWADSPCTTFRYCELAAEQKTPVHNGWQTNTKSFDEVWDVHQANRSNIGLVLGNTSGVMDIDATSSVGNINRLWTVGSQSTGTICTSVCTSLILIVISIGTVCM